MEREKEGEVGGRGVRKRTERNDLRERGKENLRETERRKSLK